MPEEDNISSRPVETEVEDIELSISACGYLSSTVVVLTASANIISRGKEM